MAQQTGTYGIADLLAARFQTVAEFGLDTIQQVLQADLDVHNGIVDDMMGDLAESSADRQRKYGTSGNTAMQEVDEFGAAPTQKLKTGGTVGFPLRKFQHNLGWTESWFQVKTPADMAQLTISAEEAHLRMIRREIQRAIFRSSNYTFRDHLIDNVDLAVKRLVNADSADIPNGPNGETFNAATHTHYLGTGSLAASDVIALIDTVVEHGHGGEVRLVINKAQETAVRALSGFTAYLDPRVSVNANANQATGRRLDITRLDNRAIGIFHSAEVWVKPWGIANYLFAYDASDGRKPLVYRQRAQATLRGLRIAAQFSSHPLHADFMEADFGLGVWTRTNGAVLYISNATYADPTIN